LWLTSLPMVGLASFTVHKAKDHQLLRHVWSPPTPYPCLSQYSLFLTGLCTIPSDDHPRLHPPHHRHGNLCPGLP
jgi:hypothetical protein